MIPSTTGYFKTVTLGAFTWRDSVRIGHLFEGLRALSGGWILLHFFLITLCLNFPAALIVTRLTPYELYSRLYGEAMINELPDELRSELAAETAGAFSEESIAKFNLFMLENGYGKYLLLPILGLVFCVMLIIQAAFYLCAAFFLGLSRMNAAAISFRNRLALAVFSSTLPVIAAALLGLFLPAVHIIVFYFIIIFVIFQRSKLCPNG